jgi:CRP-like cAMP-binding protein
MEKEYQTSKTKEKLMKTGALGKEYQDGEIIIRQGEKGDCLYVIQEGSVEVYTTVNGQEIHLAKLGEGDFFGEMAVFDQTERSSSVRALGQARALTVDKRNLLRRMEEDPSLAFRFLETMSTRIRGLDHQFSQMHNSTAQAAEPAMAESDTAPNFVCIAA